MTLTAAPPAHVTRVPAALSRGWVASYALFWVAGAAPLWWPVTFVRLLRERGPRQVPLALLLVPTTLAVSLLLALPGAPLGRLLGASLNLLVWVSLLLAVTSPVRAAAARGAAAGLVDLALVQAALVVAAHVLHPLGQGTVLPLARLLPGAVADQPNVAALTTVRLAFPDYFGEPVLRTGGLFGTPTWAALLAATAVVLVVGGRDAGVLRGAGWTRRALVVAALAPTLVLAYSRNTVVALLLSVGLLVAVRCRDRLGALPVAAAGWALLPLAVGLLLFGPAERWAAQYNDVRAGSLTSRVEIYSATVRELQEAPVPGLGVGVKQEQAGLEATVGSHSTYLGLAYKGGPVAAVGLVAWLLAVAVRAWRAGDPTALALVLLIALWAVGEDLDVGHLAPVALVVATSPVTRRSSS